MTEEKMVVGLDDLPREWALLVKLALGRIAGLERALFDVKTAHDVAIRAVTGPNISTKIAYDGKVERVLKEKQEKFHEDQKGDEWQLVLQEVFTGLMGQALSIVKRNGNPEKEVPS